jgi:outer membrane protein assembly factor BamA
VGDLRFAAGLGVRVVTPAGPLRAEYGWKLDAEPGESSGEFFLSFGVPF